ncbi:hypothetical protein ACFLQ8_03700 [Candidatus Auribacterota bacterium]
MKFVIPAAITLEISVPVRKGQFNSSNIVVDIELIVEADNEKDALRKAEEHIEKNFVKNIKTDLKNYSVSRNPIPFPKDKDTAL